jgi:hypothetical protein
MEILRSWFTKYRFVPYSELRLDMECNFPVELEKHIHQVLASQQFMPNEKVDGGTEMFWGINELRVITYLRNFNENLVKEWSKLSEADCRILCRLLSQ